MKREPASHLTKTRFQRMLGALQGEREMASRSSRFLARLLSQDFTRPGRGTSFAFCTLDGEGTATDMLLMLAYCMQSELSCKVLVIDAPVHTGPEGITARLGFTGSGGFSDALVATDTDVSVAIRRTSVTNVDVLPRGAGELAFNPANAAPVRRVLEQATAAYSYVLVQAGSPLRDTRNLHVALQADGLFVLAREHRTRMQTLDQCRKVLAENGLHDAPVVLAAQA